MWHTFSLVCKHLEYITIGGLKSEKQFSLYCITMKRILKSGKIPAQNVKDLMQATEGVVDYSILSSMDQLQVVWLILKVLFSLLTSQNCCRKSVYKSVNANLFPVRIPSCLLVVPGWVLLHGCWCWGGPAEDVSKGNWWWRKLHHPSAIFKAANNSLL